MIDLAEFIRARLDEDEAAARAAADGVEKMSGEPFAPPTQAFGVTEVTVVRTHIARHDPARVLREVAAKRAILAEHQAVSAAVDKQIAARAPAGEFAGDAYLLADPRTLSAQMTLIGVLHHLAAAWSDHPDYQPEWKPA